MKKVGCDWNSDSEWGGGDQIAERASDRKFRKMEGVRTGIIDFLSTLTQSLCAYNIWASIDARYLVSIHTVTALPKPFHTISGCSCT